MEPIEIIRIVLISVVLLSVTYLLVVFFFRKKHDIAICEAMCKTNDYRLFDMLKKIEDSKLQNGLLVLATFYQSIEHVLEERNILEIVEINAHLKKLEDGHIPHARYFRILHDYVLKPFSNRFHLEQLFELTKSYQMDHHSIEQYTFEQYLFSRFVRKQAFWMLLASPILHEFVLTLSYGIETTKLINHLMQYPVPKESTLGGDLIKLSSNQTGELHIFDYLFDKTKHYFDRTSVELYRFTKDVENALGEYIQYYINILEAYKVNVDKTKRDAVE